MFPKLLSVQTDQKYSLRLRYDDGTAGVADLSHLAGRCIFKLWDENDLFFQVRIDPETNALVCNDLLDLDPDSLYLQIRGLTFEAFKAHRLQSLHAAD